MNTTYVGNIFCPPETGHVFLIAGKTVDGANRLDINLKSGNIESADVALHLSVRFDEDTIVRNSQLNGVWGKEERDENRSQFTVANPLVAGERFKVYIFVSEQRFHVAINDDAYCTFAFRMDVHSVRTVDVLHDLQVITQCDQRATFPAPWPTLQPNDALTEDGWPLEFSNDSPGRFTFGHVIVVTAIPYGNAHGQFLIRFTEGATRKQGLHFNARFDPEYAVVRNSMSDKLEFGVEERDGVFPFFIDEQFKLAIAFTQTGFKFAVNGRPFGSTFGYRSNVQVGRLNGLKITSSKGMHMEVTGVDHMHTGDPECADFETYSHPELNVLNVAERVE